MNFIPGKFYTIVTASFDENQTDETQKFSGPRVWFWEEVNKTNYLYQDPDIRIFYPYSINNSQEQFKLFFFLNHEIVYSSQPITGGLHMITKPKKGSCLYGGNRIFDRKQDFFCFLDGDKKVYFDSGSAKFLKISS